MLDHRQSGVVVGEEQIKLLTLVDIFEPLSREELENINWKHLNTSIERGETFYTPMDLCETHFVLQKGRIRIYKSTPEGREFTIAVVVSGTVFGEMVLTGQRLRSLETWCVTSEQQRFFDSYTEPLDVLADTAPVDRLRGYNTEKNAVLFQREAYELEPVSRAVEELQQRAEEEMQKPRFD